MTNPYRLADRELLDAVRSGGWGDEFDLVQMVMMHFTRLRATGDVRRFDGIYFTVGCSPEEFFMHESALRNGVTANDSIHREHSWLGRRKLTHPLDCERLIGKTVFVSHTIRGYNMFLMPKVVYHMHRIYGNSHRDAGIIRKAMCEAKICMLERVIAYPQCPDYLSCDRGFFDYEARIRRAISHINMYPSYPTPQDIILT